jgi:hypothetical protein
MSEVLAKWDELKTIVESIELDVRKNAAGNASAGVRARKGLRALKAVAADLVKVTLSSEKSSKASEAEED